LVFKLTLQMQVIALLVIQSLMTTLLSNNVGELLNLCLSANKGTESLLAELLGTLILRVLDQFHDTTLIRSKSSDFTNKIADELGALALNTLLVGRSDLEFTAGSDVTLVEANSDSMLSQFQTPAAPRSVRRFFRVWSP
jgi:hypothetical protein